VTGVFAQVQCIQEFGNQVDHPLEAVYKFPLPDDAAVMRCVMRSGNKTVEATLKKRKEARQDYQEALLGGHHASLLEQERPNLFTMNVGGIEPGETIHVEMTYVQRIPWQDGGGRFCIPLVVAPQFIPGQPTGRQGGGWSPDTDEVPDASRITPAVAREGVPYHADISIRFSPGFACDMRSPSHPSVIAEHIVQPEETVALQTGKLLTDRDFTLVYKSLSHAPEVAVHRGEFESEHFLLTSIIPPGARQVEASDIALVLDCSGSMEGAKISGLKIVAKQVVRLLKEQGFGHRVGIVPFDSQVYPMHALDEISEATEHFIDGLRARGGTRLGLALQAAQAMLSQQTKRPRNILMVTDGDTEDGKDWRGQGIRLIGMGLDTAVNDTRINSLAQRNGGVAEFVYPGEDYSAVAQRLTGFLSGPVLQEVAVETNGEAVGVMDVFQGRPATIAVRFPEAPERVRITGKGAEGSMSWDVSSHDAHVCTFAPQIWARDFLREHSTDQERQTDVSLTYGVLCAHTSFVAISRKEVAGEPSEMVEVPVNLPDTWNYDAVFGQGNHAAGAYASRELCRRMSDDGSCYDLAEESVDFISSLNEPIVPQGLLERFAFDANVSVDLFWAMTRYNWEDESVQQWFTSVQQDLTCEFVAKLSEEQRAMAYYFALRLAKYGLRLASEVTRDLAVEPAPHTPAWSWYNLALMEQGRPYDAWVPDGYEATDYLQAKFQKL
jgi:Ca-activated chloride channel family protein